MIDNAAHPLQTYLERAVASDLGIILGVESDQAARQLRRRLYGAREALRSVGHIEFACLSFLIKPGEVWIVRRDRLNRPPPTHYPSRPINADELPRQILARGRSRRCNLSYF